MGKTIKINDHDYTNYFTPVGMTTSYKKITGSNGGTMLSGLQVEDVIAIKAVITITCIPLSESQQSALITDIFSKDYPSLYYFDAMKGTYRKIDTIAEISEQTYRGKTAGGEYWSGIKLTFTER